MVSHGAYCRALTVIKNVNRFLLQLSSIFVRCGAVLCGVVFGSHVYGQPDEWSDIDLVVISPMFDPGEPREHRALLRRAAREAGQPVEAIPCGERQWVNDDVDPIIETARRRGMVITPPDSFPALTSEFHDAIARARRQERSARQRERALAEGRTKYIFRRSAPSGH